MTTEAPHDPRTRFDLIADLPRALHPAGRDAGPLADLALAGAALLDGPARLIDQGGALFDPLTAPEPMLPYVAHWLGYGALFRDPAHPDRMLPLTSGFPPGAARLRLFLSAWPELQARRALPQGLQEALRLATGLETLMVHVDVTAQHLEITAPQEAKRFGDWLGRLTALCRPAHLTWALRIDKGHSK